MRNLTEEEIRKAGEIFSKRMQKYPREIRIAVGLTMTNVISEGMPLGNSSGFKCRVYECLGWHQ